MKCDNCNEKASIHLTEIREGKQINKALCMQCAIQIGGMTDTTKMPINEVHALRVGPQRLAERSRRGCQTGNGRPPDD